MSTKCDLGWVSACGLAVVFGVLCSFAGTAVCAQNPPAAQTAGAVTETPAQLISATLANDDRDEAQRQVYAYLANERSARTGGQTWTERVVQTRIGRLRLLLAVDGKPVSADALRNERAGLDAIAADPSAFEAQEASERSDESNARKMMHMLPDAFLFDDVQLRGGLWQMNFGPNPAYTPHGVQERVFYGMSGVLRIDARQQRLVYIHGELKQDVSIGFGLLATVHAGSSFVSERREVDGHWRTVHVVSDIHAKAALFKEMSRNADVTRWDFQYLAPETTVAQAVAMLEKPAAAAISQAGASGKNF